MNSPGTSISGVIPIAGLGSRNEQSGTLSIQVGMMKIRNNQTGRRSRYVCYQSAAGVPEFNITFRGTLGRLGSNNRGHTSWQEPCSNQHRTERKKEAHDFVLKLNSCGIFSIETRWHAPGHAGRPILSRQIGRPVELTSYPLQHPLGYSGCRRGMLGMSSSEDTPRSLGSVPTSPLWR